MNMNFSVGLGWKLEATGVVRRRPPSRSSHHSSYSLSLSLSLSLSPLHALRKDCEQF
jgi:hypothetical protein